MEVHYVDTSALVKLVRSEVETPALVAWLTGRTFVVSDLHRTELRRAAARVGPVATARAEALLVELDTLTLDGSTFDDAGRLEPPDLRSLDALHLACARTLGADLAGVVAYDTHLLDAAARLGLPTASPH